MATAVPRRPAQTADIADVLTDVVRAAIAREIAEAGGREVFFIGQTSKGDDSHLRVTQVEAVARGNDSSVPAVMQLCRYGDVVIHNHPSGVLAPSGADVSVASTLGAMGVGFHIVSSAADRVYVVVKAFEIPVVEPLDVDVLEGDLAPDGTVARALGDYEHRPTQVQMLRAVAEALNGHRVALIEAGTGTGKSLAYLLPAIRWAKRNRQRVVVSTSTINLQEQLIHKDLPFLREHLGEEFHAVLAKGRTNYLCRRKLDALMREKASWDFEQRSSAAQVEEIAAWAERSDDGSLSDLSLAPNGEVWERVQSHSDTTLRVRCPFYDKCFFYSARRAASRADLLVVNHSLLLSDLSIRAATNNWSGPAALPPYHQVILDEAHNVEEAATSHFTRRITRGGLRRQLGRLIRSRRRQAGVLPDVWRKVCDAMAAEQDPLLQRLADDIEGPLREERFAAGAQVEEIFDRLEEAMANHHGGEPRPGQELTLRLTDEVRDSPLWRDAVGPGLADLARGVESLVEKLQAFLRAAGQVSDKAAEPLQAPVIELRALVNQLAEAASTARFLARGADARHCLWISLSMSRARRLSLRVAAAPLSVAEPLRAALFEKFPSVILTSATLSVAGRFDYIERQVGLEGLGGERVSELALPAPFDYERQALVAVAGDMPDPNGPAAADAQARVIGPAVLASRGRAFVLFTSYRMLNEVHRRLAPELAAAGLRVLRQGDTNRLALLRQFQGDPAPVLFATSSFWEGVDVKGEGLVNLILTKIPFQVPTDPLLEARAEALARDGGDPFTEMQLPRAVLKFKQGFGRLIRHRTDRGCVLLLDSRLVRRGYGQTFLRSLPTTAVRVMGDDELTRAVHEFFKEDGAQ